MAAGLLEKIFNKIAGDFFVVDKKDMYFKLGEFRLKEAELRASSFDDLHMPFVLKAGYVDKVSAQMPVANIWTSGAAARVDIRDVFLVMGPHRANFLDYRDAARCKTNLVNLVMKVYELKSSKKKKKKKPASGFMNDLRNKMMEDMKKKFLGMLEVHISNIHFRFEDPGTARGGIHEVPFACGYKIGLIHVTSQVNSSSLRVSGEWRGSKQRQADPFFSQSVSARRISVYWDVDEDPVSMITAKKPIQKAEMVAKFRRFNIREQFVACVVEKMLHLPVLHDKRARFDGPCYRERHDFHRYMVFPVTANAHVIANRPSEATRLERAPTKDVDFSFEPIELALDSEQVRCMQRLKVYKAEFELSDALLLTRPHRRIAELRGSSPEKMELIRGWWQHALNGVCTMCSITRVVLGSDVLSAKANLKKIYIAACIDDLQAADAVVAAAKDSPALQQAQLKRQLTTQALADMQMKISIGDIVAWRLSAKAQKLEQQDRAAALAAAGSGSEWRSRVAEDEGVDVDEEEVEEQVKPPPNTVQFLAHFKSFQCYFLVVTSRALTDALSKSSSKADDQGLTKRGTKSLHKRSGFGRQLVVKAQAEDMITELVMRGDKDKRVAKWLEFTVGTVSVVNCTASKGKPARQVLAMSPIENSGEASCCFFLGFNILDAFKEYVPGDVPLAAVIDASRGAAAHKLCDSRPNASAGLLIATAAGIPASGFPSVSRAVSEKLGILRPYLDGRAEVGRTLWCICVRIGQTRLLDFSPFRKRVTHFLGRGGERKRVDLVRRPSSQSLDRDLLQKLQRRVQQMTGSSNLLSIVDGACDGVRVRQVDVYNKVHALCKEASLAPLQWKVLRNGKPQAFHAQLHQRVGDREAQAILLLPSQPLTISLLPWKIGMMLLPMRDFTMGADFLGADGQGRGSTMSTMSMDSLASANGQRRSRRDDQPRESVADSACAAISTGAPFLKWGRNGRAKKRFVQYDDAGEAIVWKDKHTSDAWVGTLPLSKVQDIVVGISTPVLRKAGAKANGDLLLSVVAEQRTLDLQADTAHQRDTWVLGLKMRYKRFMQKQAADDLGQYCSAQAGKPKEKQYPEKFRSECSNMRMMYKKLQAVQALSKTMNGHHAAAA